MANYNSTGTSVFWTMRSDEKVASISIVPCRLHRHHHRRRRHHHYFEGLSLATRSATVRILCTKCKKSYTSKQGTPKALNPRHRPYAMHAPPPLLRRILHESVAKPPRRTSPWGGVAPPRSPPAASNIAARDSIAWASHGWASPQAAPALPAHVTHITHHPLTQFKVAGVL